MFHNGSDGYWYTAVWLAPERDLGVFMATNAGIDAARTASEVVLPLMIARLSAGS